MYYVIIVIGLFFAIISAVFMTIKVDKQCEE